MQDHSEGFTDLLEIAGTDFQYQGQAFRGLLNRHEPQQEAFDLTPTDDDAVIVFTDPNLLPEGLLKVGAYFSDVMEVQYRITKMKRPPGKPFVQLECTLLTP